MALIPGISLGSIIQLFSDSQTIPQYKSKFSIVIGVCQDHITYGTVFINTDTNMDVLNSQELLDLQVVIIPGGNMSFLNRKSYVNCSDIKIRTKSELEVDLQKGRILQACPKKLFALVTKTLKNASTSKRHYLNLFGIAKPGEGI